MISNAKIKDVHLLCSKKHRDEMNMFIAEGNKIVADIINAFECEWLLAHNRWLATQGDIQAKEIILADEKDIKKVSLLSTPQDVFAVFKKPDYQLSDATPASDIIIALDGIQDPGNLGTIVRIADWFGIKDIICSTDSADVFAPKAIQATMGSIANVRVHYTELSDYLDINKTYCIYGTFLNGKNIFSQSLNENGIIVIGNEGNGIRKETELLIKEKLFIPPFSSVTQRHHAIESLNAAIATAIVCSEFRRNKLINNQL